jgi:hypothetical protein
MATDARVTTYVPMTVVKKDTSHVGRAKALGDDAVHGGQSVAAFEEGSIGVGGSLEPETGVRASAIDEGIEEQTEDGIEESEKHDRASWQVESSRSAGPAGTWPLHPISRLI